MVTILFVLSLGHVSPVVGYIGIEILEDKPAWRGKRCSTATGATEATTSGIDPD